MPGATSWHGALHAGRAWSVAKPESKTRQGWTEFDRLVAQRETENSPWWSSQGIPELKFDPQFDLLEELLAVPIRLGLTTTSGMPAKAVDVWIAHQLRRAGFGVDEVWPRASTPRVLPREVALLRGLGGMRGISDALFDRIDRGLVGKGVTGADAKILGKAYEKQVDVVIAQWARGPELMISTKRMDSSFGNNALNRIEESYGDAKNLRGRHPLAATGFLFVLRSTAFDYQKDTALRLMDLIVKLAKEPDAYDATSVIVVEWKDLASGAIMAAELDEGKPLNVAVKVREDLIPEALRPDRFLAAMVNAVIDRTPINLHEEVRKRLGQEVPEEEGVTGAYDSESNDAVD